MSWNDNIFPFLLYILPVLTCLQNNFRAEWFMSSDCCELLGRASVCYAVRVDYETVSLETVFGYTYVF